MRKKTHFLVRRAFLALAFLVALPFPLRGAENPFEALQNQAFLLIQEKASEGEDLFWRGAYREALQRARELPLYATGSSSALSLARGFQSLLEAQVASRRGFDEEGLRKASEARSFFEKISHVSGELLALEVLLRSVHALDLEEERRRFEEELQGRREFREDPYGAALALLHRGIRAFEARNCSEARRYWKECAEISENLKNPEMYGLAIKHAARCAWLEGRVENSLEEYAEALDFARRSASSWLECMVSLEYAEVLVRQKGDYLRGEELLLAALEKAERLELGAPLLWICNNLGALYLEAGSFSRGEAILEKARKIQRRPGIPRDLGLLVNLGSAAMGVGDFEESEHWWLQARDLALRQKAEEELPGIALNLGVLAKKRGRYVEASEFFSQALKGFDALGRERDAAGVMLQLGNLLVSLKDFRRAREALGEAKRIYASLEDRAGMAYVFLEEGKLAVAEKKPSRGKDIFENLLERAEELGSPELRLGALEGLGRCYLEEHDPRGAREILEEAMELLEEERRGYAFVDRKVAFLDYAASVYELLFETCLGEEDLSGALEILEKLKARSFFDLMSARKVTLHPEEARLIGALDALDAEIGLLRKRETYLLSRGFSPESPEIRGLREILERTFEKAELLETELQRASPRLQALSEEDVLSPEEIRKGLPEHGTFLHYYYSLRGGGVLLVRKDSLRWISLGGTSESIRERIVRLMPDLSDADRPLPRKELQELYTLLMEPLQKFLPPGERIVVIPHGALGYLPFETLLEGDRYLVESCTLSYAPSLTTILLLPKIFEGGAFPKNAFFAGNPLYPDPGLAPLQAAEEEALLIRRFFSRALVLTGEKATESAVKEEAPNWELLHWATHARADARAPLKSEILFTRDDANDGFLQAWEIFEMNFGAQCVVLSACETGLGQLSDQEGLIGFVRSFLAGGVPSMVVSLWSVYDLSTRDFFLAFYTYWKGGMSRAEALRKAKARLATSYSHPAYWAPFVLYGW